MQPAGVVSASLQLADDILDTLQMVCGCATSTASGVATIYSPSRGPVPHQHTVFDANLRWVRARMRCVDGFYELPEGPGLGVEPAPELWAHVLKT